MEVHTFALIVKSLCKNDYMGAIDAPFVDS